MREKELSFSIFMIYSLADKWKMSPAKVYIILNSTGILDDYIIKCYDVLHTQKIWLRMNRSFLDNYGMIVLEKYANALGKHIEIKICDDWQIFIQRIIYDNIKCNNIKGGMTIARKLSVWFPGATYHIMHRGVRRKPIFEDEMR